MSCRWASSFKDAEQEDPVVKDNLYIDAHHTLSDGSVAEEVRLMLGKATQEWRKSRSELLLVAAAGRGENERGRGG